MDYLGDGLTAMAATLIVTGASGFLGQSVIEAAAAVYPEATIIPVRSPRSGGIDLTRPGAAEQLSASVCVPNPQDAVLIHAAAVLEWDTPAGFLGNAAMALHVATWARTVGIGFCILVSSVEVYGRHPISDAAAPCEPTTMYGLGKWTAEQVWRQQLVEGQRAVVRLAGVWGWQQRPTLFWNRLLLAAVRGVPPEPRLTVHSPQSRRNYISAREASECLLQVGRYRMTGVFLGAGRDIVETESFLTALRGLSRSTFSVEQGGGEGVDERIYPPSAELLRWLHPFPEALAAVWRTQPQWILESS
jgi:nucleoside-diphosphate-sugar epimerase